MQLDWSNIIISSDNRIFDEKRNVIIADCDDDGETGASSRMLHLMDVSICRLFHSID